MMAPDWYRDGFGAHLIPYSPNEFYYLDLRTASDIPEGNTVDYAIAAANHILDRYPKPINVLLSGGIDSQAMVDAFLRTGRTSEFRIVTFRFNDGLNEHDIAWANGLHNAMGFEHEIIDFDVIGFHENELLEWGKRYINHSPHSLSHTKMVSMLDGTSVLAGNPAIVDVNNQITGMPNFSLMGTRRYCSIENIPVVAMFFMHTPELFYSFFRWRNDGGYEAKCNTFKQAGFRFLQPPSKYHGFETLKERYDSAPKIDLRRSKHYAAKYNSDRIYDHLFRHPLMEDIPYIEKSISIPEKRMFTIGNSPLTERAARIL